MLTVLAGIAFGSAWPSLAILGACLSWGIDNNLTRKVAIHDASWLAAVKGGVAGPVNLVLAFVLVEPVTVPLVVAGVLMAVGIWLHLTERHEHEHTHEAVTHDHWHHHDEHHQHEHDEPVAVGTWHRHVHTHEPITHTHEHYPDSHHRHTH